VHPTLDVLVDEADVPEEPLKRRLVEDDRPAWYEHKVEDHVEVKPPPLVRTSELGDVPVQTWLAPAATNSGLRWAGWRATRRRSRILVRSSQQPVPRRAASAARRTREFAAGHAAEFELARDFELATSA
jgi:hypothetical protein